MTLTLTTTGLRTQALSGSQARARSALRLTWKKALRALRVLPAEAPGGVAQLVSAGPLCRSRSSPQPKVSDNAPHALAIRTKGPESCVVTEAPGVSQLNRPLELAASAGAPSIEKSAKGKGMLGCSVPSKPTPSGLIGKTPPLTRS